MGLTTLYIDVENLQDLAKNAIISAMAQWPTDFPRPSMMRLYVRADQTELWHIWASHNFPSVKVGVEGVQRYGYGPISKNLADMSLVLDAIVDLLRERTTHVAILSDDSDYVALFTTIKQEMSHPENGRLPFIWLLTDRPDTHSSALNDFLPSSYLHTISCSENGRLVTAKPKDKVNDDIGQIKVKAKKNVVVNPQSENESIAKAIVQSIQAGFFRNADCMKIVKRLFPKSQLAHAESAQFGSSFVKDIWPILERYGVELTNPGKPGRKYEMTAQVKERASAE